jgi:hypothetical protein
MSLPAERDRRSHPARSTIDLHDVSGCAGRRIRGVLATTIFHGSEKVLTDVGRNFELQPGQWIVAADIVIPPAGK